jgi:hypothetical protein
MMLKTDGFYSLRQFEIVQILLHIVTYKYLFELVCLCSLQNFDHNSSCIGMQVIVAEFSSRNATKDIRLRPERRHEAIFSYI